MNILFEIPDALIIGIIAVIVLIIIIVAFFIRAHSRKVKPIGEEERYDKEEIDEIEVKEITKEEMTDDQLEAKKELERLYQKMSEDLEKQNSASDEIEEFEKEQEENAIISYQELMAQADKLKEEAKKYEKTAEDKADMKVREAIQTFKKRDIKKSKKEMNRSKPNESKYGTNKGFKSSDIISPIYGVQSNKKMLKKKTDANKEKSDIISKAYEKKQFEDEKTQNLDFLNSLKEFRKNL